MNRLAARALSLACALTLFACSSADPWQVNPGCASVCERTAECLAAGTEGEDLCFAQCSRAAAGAGQLAQDVVDGCAACVERTDCGGLVTGACAGPCPHGVFGGVAPRDDAGIGPADAGAMDPRDRCESAWLAGGASYEIVCSRELPPDDYAFHCECFRDGLREASFRSTDICEVDDSMRASRAERGCVWELAE